METRLKLQAQLDTLLSKTSARMAVYTSERKSEENTKKVEKPTLQVEEKKSQHDHFPEVDNNVKSLIKSVANEIQKSFSRKNLNVDDEDEDEDEKSATEGGNENLETSQQFKNKNNPLIDSIFNTSHSISFLEPTVETPIDFDSVPEILDSSLHREK